MKYVFCVSTMNYYQENGDRWGQDEARAKQTMTTCRKREIPKYVYEAELCGKRKEESYKMAASMREDLAKLEDILKSDPNLAVAVVRRDNNVNYLLDNNFSIQYYPTVADAAKSLSTCCNSNYKIVVRPKAEFEEILRRRKALINAYWSAVELL